MKLIIALLLTLALVTSQSAACSVCSKIAKCPKDLFSDNFIDPIYNSLVQQVKLSTFPQEITRETSSKSAIYTFIWPAQSYIANVDLSTNKFTITVQSTVKNVKNAQNQLGLRTYDTKATVSDSDTTSHILSQIDSGIRNKYFPGQTVTCTEISSTPKGYLVIYKKLDNTIHSFDVAVQNTNGNVMVTYTPTANVQSKTATTTTATTVTQLSEAAQSTTSQQTTPTIQQSTTPTAGGFSSIEQPLNDKDVRNVIVYLNQQLNNVLNLASLLKAERQVVAGMNYRLSLSFDTSSSAYYVVLVYRDLSQKYSITSITLTNVPSTYKFTTPLTSAQASQMSYLSSLSNAIAQQLPSLLVSGSVLNQIFISFPFYQFVYSNAAYSKIVVIVSFDILANKLSIISREAVAVQISQPKPSGNLQTNTIQNSPSLLSVSAQLLNSDSVQSYIKQLASQDSCYALSNLIGVFWSDQQKTTLCFRYNSIKDVIVSLQYIQFQFRQIRTTPPQIIRIDNCLQQKGQICIECAFKYYLNGGKCFPVAPQCSNYDYKRNRCNQCYNGFYLDLNNVCQVANFLCATSDRRGNCLTCYRDYSLTKSGLCVFNAQGDNFCLVDQQLNPLCSKFKEGKCVACTKGCYLNSQSICKVPDQNCQDYDQVKEVCKVCMHKYVLSETSKRCVPASKY